MTVQLATAKKRKVSAMPALPPTDYVSEVGPYIDAYRREELAKINLVTDHLTRFYQNLLASGWRPSPSEPQTEPVPAEKKAKEGA
jgi:hypothetical protein